MKEHIAINKKIELSPELQKQLGIDHVAELYADQVKRLMMVKHVEISDEERILVKKELKGYIKEIDKCLALLNK